MNHTDVPDGPSAADLLERLQAERPGLAPQLRKAAGFLLDSPGEIGLSSIRQLAQRAGVTPNTLVRLARALGMESYDAFREAFRAEIRQGRETYPDRARWLQSLPGRGALGGLYAATAAASIDNLEGFFAGTDHGAIERAARAILLARRRFVLGVGVAHPAAESFAYLASMALDGVQALPSGGTLPVDGLARAGAEDILVAMTFRPFRREVVEAVEVARGRGVAVIAISDSLACPILAGAEHRFLVPTETPQFFTSTVALTAFFEVLLAFVIAEAGEGVVASIEAVHERRHALGIYVEEEDPRP